MQRQIANAAVGKVNPGGGANTSSKKGCVVLLEQHEWDYEDFKRWVYRRSGINLSNYKQQQMQRRINSLMANLRVGGYREYARLLEADSKRYEEFLNRLTINVTEFFRNPERFEELEKQVLPELARMARGSGGAGGGLKVWSAGCASGAEAYSLAILLVELEEQGAGFCHTVAGTRVGTQSTGAIRHRILATDVDREVLERARVGVYGEADLKNVSEARRRRFFTRRGPDLYAVDETLKQLVQFRAHDLLLDPFESGFDLILCRNVVIYFTEEAKDLLYRKFFAALRPGGVLLVGGTEPILRYRDYGFEALQTTFYRKPVLAETARSSEVQQR